MPASTLPAGRRLSRVTSVNVSAPQQQPDLRRERHEVLQVHGGILEAGPGAAGQREPAGVHEVRGALQAERAARLTLRLEAVAASRGQLLLMHRTGDIHDDVLHALEQELDLEELRLREQLEH